MCTYRQDESNAMRMPCATLADGKAFHFAVTADGSAQNQTGARWGPLRGKPARIMEPVPWQEDLPEP